LPVTSCILSKIKQINRAKSFIFVANQILVIMRVKAAYYNAETAAVKLKYYQGLEEKYQRHFLCQEYGSLGKGSQRYLAALYKCSRNRITRGCAELSALQAAAVSVDYSRQRKIGGGAKKKKSP
jgi:hypothetical protein